MLEIIKFLEEYSLIKSENTSEKIRLEEDFEQLLAEKPRVTQNRE